MTATSALSADYIIQSMWTSSYCSGPPALIWNTTSISNSSWALETGGVIYGFCGMEFAIDCSSPGICFGNTPVSLTDLHGSFSTSQYLASITSFGANNSGASSQSLIASSANSNQYCQISSSSGSTPDTIYALNDGSCFLSRYKCSNSNLTIYAESCSQDRLATTFQLSSSTLSSVTGPDNQSYTAQMVTFNSASVNIIYTIFQIFGFVFLEFHSPQGVIGFLAVLISILLLIYHIAIYSIQLFHVLRSEGLTSSRNRRMSIVSQSGGRRGISRKWRLIVYVFTLTLCLIESITFLIEYFFVFKIPASTYPTAWTQSFNGICYSIASLITCLMNAHNLANIVFETNLSDGMLKVWSKVGLYGFIFVVWFFLGSPYLLQYILINPHSTATVANSFAFQLNQYFSGWIYPYWPIFCFCFDPLCAFIVNRFLFKTLSSSASRGEEMVGGVKRGLFTYIIHDRYLLFLNLVVFVNLFSLVISQILIQYTIALASDRNSAMLNLIFGLQHASNTLVSIAYMEHFPAVLSGLSRSSGNGPVSNTKSSNNRSDGRGKFPSILSGHIDRL